MSSFAYHASNLLSSFELEGYRDQLPVISRSGAMFLVSHGGIKAVVKDWERHRRVGGMGRSRVGEGMCEVGRWHG